MGLKLETTQPTRDMTPPNFSRVPEAIPKRKTPGRSGVLFHLLWWHGQAVSCRAVPWLLFMVNGRTGCFFPIFVVQCLDFCFSNNNLEKVGWFLLFIPFPYRIPMGGRTVYVPDMYHHKNQPDGLCFMQYSPHNWVVGSIFCVFYFWESK